jgi:predicted transcriptional regulator
MLKLIHLTATVKIPTLKAMEVHFPPDLEKKLHDLAAETGRGANELVQDAVAGFVDELAAMRGMIESRYDDLKSGRVKPIDGEQAYTRLREKSQNRRA